MKYRDYFSIDKDYLPTVNPEALKTKGKDFWKTFYPHKTFVKLLNDVESILSRKKKQSIWVEGAYGTGKSHAVLTLKAILDSSEEEMRSYFDKYKDKLSEDLFNKFQNIKNQGKILTIHRYGSSGITSDNHLIVALQESIKAAMKEQGIEDNAEESLKDSIINWLSDSDNKLYFDNLIKNKYSYKFDGDTVDTLLIKLKSYSGDSIISLINKIFFVADEVGITAMKLDITGLCSWIEHIIKNNDLKAMVFIWDEFTEYFNKNKQALTGFQQLVELSNTQPFYMIIVTHKSEALFHDTDSDKQKILDRFVQPTCNIELPENMAFQLMGAALKKTSDEGKYKEWMLYSGELNANLSTSKKMVINAANITDQELTDILPIHPYAALLLKYLSTAFESNQRSMFDFIKNDMGDEIKGFQWFIDNFGPLDSWPFLTIDMLWDFFYEKGKDHLASDIRIILDSYNRLSKNNLTEEENRVFKTVLLLQAISNRVGDSVEILAPNDKNLSNAFDGTELEHNAVSIAERLVKYGCIFKKPMGVNKFQYSSITASGDSSVIEKEKARLKDSKKTQDFVNEGDIENSLNFQSYLKLRYPKKIATVDNFRRVFADVKSTPSLGRINAIITFAKDDIEAVALRKIIADVIYDENVVVIDTSPTVLGGDALEQYFDNAANAAYQRGKDNGLAGDYDRRASEVLKKWAERIAKGEYILHTKQLPDGKRLSNYDELISELKDLDLKRYPLGLENYKVIENMYAANALSSGALCGIKEETTGTFRAAVDVMKLENALSGAWKLPQGQKYWEQKPNLTISKIKLRIEEEINKSFEEQGSIGIAHLYDILKSEPFGFMPCNLTAFMMGFLLKEYASSTYRWSDGSLSDNMDENRLKEMIKEVIDLQINNNPRYREKYIKKMTDEERKFISVTSKVFGIPDFKCNSIEQVREGVRDKLKDLSFPLWVIKYVFDGNNILTDRETISTIIDAYCGVANSKNYTDSNSQTELDIALSIGKCCLQNENLESDLQLLITKENCRLGMKAYLKEYKNGILIDLANQISDHEDYLSLLKVKFDASDANWVWNKDTVNKQIDELILEYSITATSYDYSIRVNSYNKCISEWRDKVQAIKLPYDLIVNEEESLSLFLKLLYEIKKNGELDTYNKEKFLNCLKLRKNEFYNLYLNQVELFKKLCSTLFQGLEEEHINNIFRALSGNNIFLLNKNEFNDKVSQTRDEYISHLGREKLKNLWRDKTESESPRDWSEKHDTPILCMISDDDENYAKEIFNIVLKTNPESGEVERAMKFIEKKIFTEYLNNKDNQDRCFMEKVVKKYSVVCDNADEIRKMLRSYVSSDVYDWYPNVIVDNKIKDFADKQYKNGTNQKVIEKINSMDSEKLRKYLIDLVSENVNVGIEIINDK